MPAAGFFLHTPAAESMATTMVCTMLYGVKGAPFLLSSQAPQSTSRLKLAMTTKRVSA